MDTEVGSNKENEDPKASHPTEPAAAQEFMPTDESEDDMISEAVERTSSIANNDDDDDNGFEGLTDTEEEEGEGEEEEDAPLIGARSALM